MKPLSLHSIGSANLEFSDGQALPNTTSADSTNILDLAGSGMLGCTPVFVRVKPPAVTLTKALTIDVKQCATVDGTYETVCTLTYDAGEISADDWKAIGLIDSKRYVKLSYTSQEDLSAETISADLVGNI